MKTLTTFYNKNRSNYNYNVSTHTVMLYYNIIIVEVSKNLCIKILITTIFLLGSKE